MIISCPACQTRYKVEPGQVGPAGRRVRCTGCGHVWTQRPAEDLPKVVDPAATEDRGAAKSSAAEGTGARARRGSAWGWAALAATVALLAVVGALGRDAIIGAWPPAERLYMAIGYLAPAPGEGLVIRVTEQSRTAAEGGAVLVIRGEIDNVSGVVRDVPELRASLWSGDARELGNWTFPAAQDRLLPGERVGFVTRYENPPAATESVSVGFAVKGK